MSTAKEIFDSFHSIRKKKSVTQYELSQAKLKAVSDTIHLKIPAAVQGSETLHWATDYTSAYVYDAQNSAAIPLFVSEGDWAKVPVYLKIGEQNTYAGSFIAHFTNDNIVSRFSNRLIRALYDNKKSTSELKQLDIDLAIAEEDLRKTIVAASSGNGKKLGATTQEVLENITNIETRHLCESMFRFLFERENNPFYSVSDTLKIKHFEQLGLLKNLLTSPDTSKGSVQTLRELHGQINPWPTTAAGLGLIFIGGLLLLSGLCSLPLLVFDDLHIIDTLIQLISLPESSSIPLIALFQSIAMMIGYGLAVTGVFLAQREFVLPPAILDAEHTAGSRAPVVVQQEQVHFQTIVEEVQYAELQQPQSPYNPTGPGNNMKYGVPYTQGTSYQQQPYCQPPQANLGNSQPGRPPASGVAFSPDLQSFLYEKSWENNPFVQTSVENSPLLPRGNYGSPVISQPPSQQPQNGYLPQVNPQPYQPGNNLETYQLGANNCPPGYPPGYQQ